MSHFDPDGLGFHSRVRGIDILVVCVAGPSHERGCHSATWMGECELYLSIKKYFMRLVRSCSWCIFALAAFRPNAILNLDKK